MIKKFTGTLLFPVLVFIVPLFVFFPSVHCLLTNWDVDPYIYNNPYLRSISLENLQNIFSRVYFLNYQPLTLLSFSVEYYFFGINPPVMHFINILLHLINTLLVYYFIRTVSGSQWTGFLTALLFSIHPMRVESVTWVVERKDCLYSLFFLAGLLSYFKYLLLKPAAVNTVEPNTGMIRSEEFAKPLLKDHNTFYLVSILCMLFSCLSKAMGVAFPLTLLAVDFFVKRKDWKNLIIDKIPFLLFSIIFGFLAIIAASSKDRIEAIADYTITERMLFSCYALFFYFYKFFLPLHLSVFYPYLIKSGQMPGVFWIYPVLLVILTFFIFYSLKYTRIVVFGMGIFLSTLFFIIPFHPINLSIVYERYTYLAHIGISFIIASGFLFLMRRNWSLKLISPRMIRISCIGLFLLWMLWMGFLTRLRIEVWKDSFTLWSDYISEFPTHYLGYLGRGTRHAEWGHYDLALADLNNAIHYNPITIEGLVNRGNVFAIMKEYKKAAADYSEVIEKDPKKPEILYNRGTARWLLGDREGACSDWRLASAMGYSKAAQKLKKECGN